MGKEILNYVSTLPSVEQAIEEMADRFIQIRPQPLPLRKTKATSQLTKRMQTPVVKTLNERELSAVYSLLAWVANEQSISPVTIHALTEKRFGVNDVSELPRKDYDEVIRFLVELRRDEIQN